MLNLRSTLRFPALALLVACDGTPSPVSPATTLPDGAVVGTTTGGASTGGIGATTGGTASQSDGGTTGTTGTTGTAGATGCQPILHTAGATYGGVKADTYAWYDASCKLRTTGLVPNTSGSGGYARGFTYDVGGRTRSAMGTNSHGYNGFGYVVSHYGSGGTSAAISQGVVGTYRVVLAGAHHAIHEFKMRVSPGGPVDVTIQYFFATGRSNPIYAITLDATPAGADAVGADTRSPYSDVAFDEGPTADNNIDGVGWGDKYRFVTTGNGPLTFANGFDYSQPNTIPYAMEWANKADAEMGLVQTQTFAQHEAGGDYGGGVLSTSCWGKTSATQAAACKDPKGLLPNDWLWPVQLNQYELPYTAISHRLAWGGTFGAVGKKQYSGFGVSRSGYPYNSYAVAVVLGAHSAKAVDAQRVDTEASQATRITASRGAVATSGPGGVGRSDSVAYAPAGYNPIYAAWELTAAQNAITAQVTAGASPLKNPVFRLLGFGAAAPSHVRVGGRELTAGVGYFATVDSASKILWMTLNETLTGTTVLEIE